MTSQFNYENYLIFNPEGKVPQIEYAQRSTEHGNTCIVLCNGVFGVFVTYQPLSSKLEIPKKKIFQINDNSLFSFSGITNDGLEIVQYLRTSFLQENVIKDRQAHYIHVFDDLSVDAAYRTLAGNSRLYGASGLFLTEYEGSIHAVEFRPSGTVREVVGGAIGRRSQSCKTILRDRCDQLKEQFFDLPGLIKIGVDALCNAYPDTDDESMIAESVSIYVLERGGVPRSISAEEYMRK
jgi:20S proteasome subunit alpha 6